MTAAQLVECHLINAKYPLGQGPLRSTTVEIFGQTITIQLRIPEAISTLERGGLNRTSQGNIR